MTTATCRAWTIYEVRITNIEGLEMKKLSNLKKWLTIPEAAAYLSLMIGEPVSENDILFFGLNNSLQLSIDLVNGVQARRGTIVDADSVVTEELHEDDIINLGSSKIVLDRELVYIRGIYELPLYGEDRISLMSKFHTDTKGPTVSLLSMVGAFVTRGEDVYQLYDWYESMPTVVGSRAYHKQLKIDAESHPDEEEKRIAQVSLSHYPDARKRLLGYASKLPEWREGCIPAHKMPKDVILMVHKNALDDFLDAAHLEESLDTERPVKGKEWTNFINLVGALADLYWKAAYPGQDYSQATLLADLAKYDGYPGLKERNLKAKLTLAMKAIKAP